MEDDGLLLNLDLSAVPIKPKVKFVGGRWRDRLRAQRNFNKVPGEDGTDKASDGANGVPVDNKRPVGMGSNEALGSGERPTKRLRTHTDARQGLAKTEKLVSHMTGTLPPGSIDTEPKANYGLRPGQVTSRLFTSNATPMTVFEAPVSEAGPAKPSNAPLSDGTANFHALGLSKRLAHHLSSKLEMKAPTVIQKKTIPQLTLEDSDAFLQAETGSGKTLAYLLPIVQRIMALSHDENGVNTGNHVHRNSGLFAVVLAPTRELCKQIANVLEKLLGCAHWLVGTTVTGGESKKAEKGRIRKGVNILIATPGRLKDHLENTKVLDVGTVRWLVLDEGDRMMELGFEDELKAIVGRIRKEQLKQTNDEGVQFDKLPQRRVTILCSATMKMNVHKLGEISLQDAIHITGAPSESDANGTAVAEDVVFSAPNQLKQTYIVAAPKLRLVTLLALLKNTFARKGTVMKAIIFMSCAHSVDFYFELLRSEPPSQKDVANTRETVAECAYITSAANTTVKIMRLHGSLQQPVRTSTLASFTKATDPAVLITTDISSRGLDVLAVDMVIEYDPAFSAADHMHRVGRTARAGRSGTSVLFLQPGCEEGYIAYLQASMTGQSSETVIQKGLVSPITLPKLSASQPEAPTLESDKTPNKRAEALQLHLEQRLLDSKKGNKLLDLARKAFQAHIRAYSTHVKEERRFFDKNQLHLGHMAKSFGLREAPSGIGAGPSRKAYRAGQHRPQKEGAVQKGKAHGSAGDDHVPRHSEGESGGVDEDAAKRMRLKIKETMNAASEFNIA